MTEKKFIPDTEYMQSLVHAIYKNTQRESQGYAQLIFGERIERTIEGMAPEAIDEFVQIAIDIGGYKPTHRQVRTMDDAANDDSFE